MGIGEKIEMGCIVPINNRSRLHPTMIVKWHILKMFCSYHFNTRWNIGTVTFMNQIAERIK